MKAVVQRLLAIVRRRGVKIRFLLLDKGFLSVAGISIFTLPATLSSFPRWYGAGSPRTPSASARTASTVEEKMVTIGKRSRRRKPRKKRKPARRSRFAFPAGIPRTKRPASGVERNCSTRSEGTSHAQGDSRNLPQAFWHRNQLPPDERGANQDLHPRSTAATSVRGHCPRPAERVGVDSFSFRQRQGQRGTAVVPRTASLQRNALLDYPSHQHALGADKTLGLDQQTYERLMANYSP